MRRIGICALLLLWLLSALPGVTWADGEIELASEAAILMDAGTGQILYAKNARERLYPASITKVMTGLLALEALDAGQMLTVSQDAVNQVPRTSSHISLQPGEELTVADAMYALAISSANDAANVLAEGVSGSIEAFAQRMNERSAELGALDTHFVNPNGLPNSEHYTTAYDMALITAEALKNPDFLLYFGSGAYEMPATNISQARSLVCKNQFIDGERSCSGLLFSKTGWTTSAQGTLVTAARRDGITLIAVTLKSPMLEDKYEDTQALLDYGFSGFEKLAVDEAFVFAQLREQGMDRDAELVDFEPYFLLIPRDAEARLVVPGGIDPDSGVRTLPVSLVVRREEGAEQVLADSLLNLSFSEAEDTFYAVQTQAAEPVKRSYTLAVCLPLAALAIGAGELVLRKKKRKQ